MAIALSTAAKNTLLESGLDAAFNSGVLELRSGAAPGPNAAPTGTLVASIACPADLWAAAAAGAKALNAALTGAGAAAAAGGTTVGHFRLRESADTGGAVSTFKRLEGTVTITGGGGDLTMDNPNVATGQAITVGTLTISVP